MAINETWVEGFDPSLAEKFVPSREGIPNSWVDTLIETQSTYPQGFPILDYRMSFHFLSSIRTGEVTASDALITNLNQQQAIKLTSEANRLHAEFGIPFKVSDQNVMHTWFRTLENLAGLSKCLVMWQQNDGTDREIAIDQVIQGLGNLVEDATGRKKLDTVIALSGEVANTLRTPKNLAAAASHRLLASTDPNYFICAQQALRPVYEDVSRIVDSTVPNIKAEAGVFIPPYVTRWFK
jgi:hypothetical protein